MDVALVPPPAAPAIDGAVSLRDALARMLSLGVDALAVTGPGGVPAGVLTLAAIRARTRRAH